MKNPDILVVDDEVEIQHLFRKVLTKKGCRVETTGSGHKAVMLVKGKNYNIVFLDVRLPLVSAHEVSRHIKNIRPDTHLIMMSGKPIENRIKNVLREESDGFIHKPFRIGDIRKLVEGIITEDLNEK